MASLADSVTRINDIRKLSLQIASLETITSEKFETKSLAPYCTRFASDAARVKIASDAVF